MNRAMSLPKGRKRLRLKKRSRSPSPEVVRGRKAKSKERKKDKERKERKRRKSSSPEVERSSRKERKKRRERSSSDEPETPGLFEGGKKKKACEASLPRKGDRGPFGGGPIVEFSDEGSSSSGEESVFREAPAQSSKTNQLALVTYSQKKPGRLAARLLMKMREEAALGSAGAIDITERTPAAAVHYLLTIMQQQLGQKMNLRTQRELRTLAVSLDHLAQKSPAKAADTIAQRIKALERATAEGSWLGAQFLELIAAENSSLLDRAEQVYLQREALLEHKVNKMFTPGKGGRGEPKGQKGDKGRGKNNYNEGGGKGKTKEKDKA